MLSDIEISNQTIPFKINKIANKLNLKPEDIEPYGHYKAKISKNVLLSLEEKQQLLGKLAYYKMIEPDYFHYLNRHYTLKYNTDFEAVLKQQL